MVCRECHSAAVDFGPISKRNLKDRIERREELPRQTGHNTGSIDVAPVEVPDDAKGLVCAQRPGFQVAATEPLNNSTSCKATSV